eukprot:5827214-Karenia_brevis.AAC.1
MMAVDFMKSSNAHNFGTHWSSPDRIHPSAQYALNNACWCDGYSGGCVQALHRYTDGSYTDGHDDDDLCAFPGVLVHERQDDTYTYGGAFGATMQAAMPNYPQ